MFKPHFATCIQCDNKRLIKIKKGICDYCRNKDKPKPILAKSKIRSLSPNNKNPAKDYKFFKEIWNERPRVSEVSGELLGDYKPHYFSHILTKSAYPAFRHRRENIVLMTQSEHSLWEFGDREKLGLNNVWKRIIDLEQTLKQMYYEETNRRVA